MKALLLRITQRPKGLMVNKLLKTGESLSPLHPLPVGLPSVLTGEHLVSGDLPTRSAQQRTVQTFVPPGEAKQRTFQAFVHRALSKPDCRAALPVARMLTYEPKPALSGRSNCHTNPPDE